MQGKKEGKKKVFIVVVVVVAVAWEYHPPVIIPNCQTMGGLAKW